MQLCNTVYHISRGIGKTKFQPQRCHRMKKQKPATFAVVTNEFGGAIMGNTKQCTFLKEGEPMEELKQSQNNYNVTRESGMTVISADKPMGVNAAHYDETANRMILAVSYYYSFLAHTDYIILDDGLNIAQVFTEDEGVNPHFFAAPDNSIWAEMSSTKTDSYKTIVLPIGNRERIEKEIFLADYGFEHRIRCGGQTYFFRNDIFKRKKPDEMFHMVFGKDGLFKSRKSFKLPDPKFNIPVASGNTIHLAAKIMPQREVNHREIGLDGGVKAQRQFSLGVEFDAGVAPVSLSFDDVSTFFTTAKNRMHHVAVNKDAEITAMESFEVKAFDGRFFSIFKPCVFGPADYVVRYTYGGDTGPGAGAGFAVIKGGEIRECWVQDKDSSVYSDEIGGAAFDIGVPELILRDTLKMPNGACALIFSSARPRETQTNQVKILLKTI